MQKHTKHTKPTERNHDMPGGAHIDITFERIELIRERHDATRHGMPVGERIDEIIVAALEAGHVLGKLTIDLSAFFPDAPFDN